MRATLTVAKAAGDVANFCDHIEHNEPADRQLVLDAAAVLRNAALEVAAEAGLDPVGLYASRLAMIEQRGIAGGIAGAFDGAAEARIAATWGQLQLVQLQHDRYYHFDVSGLANSEQLRHYALHLAKLVAALAASSSSEDARQDFVDRRLADLLLFGIKLSTVMGERLGEIQLPGRATA